MKVYAWVFELTHRVWERHFDPARGHGAEYLEQLRDTPYCDFIFPIQLVSDWAIQRKGLAVKLQ